MAYIGRNLEQFSNVEKLDNITFTNSAGPYNLLKGAVAFTPVNAQSLLIEVDGIIQASDSYTVSGSTITFLASMASTSTMNSIVQLGVGLISTPADSTVTTAKLEDGAVTGAKVNSTFDVSAKTVTLPASVSGLGTGITNAQLAGSIDVTSKITGVVPTANLGSGSASASTYLAGDQSYKTITEFNDNKIVNDISTLALHQATNNNSAKYNLTNSNVDVYQDSSAIANLTNVARDTTGEYVSSVYGGTSARFTTSKEGNCTQSTSEYKFGTGSVYNAAQGDYLKTGTLTGLTGMPTTGNWTIECWAKYESTSLSGTYRILGVGDGSSNDNNNHFSFGYQNSPDTNMNFYEVGTNHTTTFPARDTNWHHYLIQGTGSGTNYAWYDGVYKYSYSNASSSLTGLAGSFLQMGGRTNSGAEDFIGYIDEVRLSNIHRHTNGSDFTVPSAAYTTDANTMALLHMDTSDLIDSSVDSSVDNATGSYESTAQTANASVSTMSAVVTYTNATGTTALNTDLVLQLSADNGSTWQSATLTAAGTFSTGVLQAVTNDISVTAGTQLKYKISFANQGESSKVTRVNGVSLSY